MKHNHFTHFALRPHLLITLFLLIGFSSMLSAQPTFTVAQPGFGRTYTGTSGGLSLDGLVTDIETEENEDYVCTVARVQEDNANNLLDREYLLIRVRRKSNGLEVTKLIDLGRQLNSTNSFLSVEMAHSETEVVIATTDDASTVEGVLLIKYNIAGSTITDQDRIRYPNFVIQDFNGIEFQRRFLPNGDGQGYTLVVGGYSGNSLALVATEMGENLFPTLSRLTSVSTTLTGSDSNDEFMLVCGNSTNSSRIKAVRYNTNTHAWDWAKEYLVFSPQRFKEPLIAYNINSSNGNRNGFFMAADEFNSSGTLRPVVFRVRNNGNMVWNKVLEEGTELRGMYHSGSRCQVLTTALPLSTGQDEYKKHSLDQGSGALISSGSFTASVDNYYDREVKLQKGYQDREILVGASTYEPASWVLFKANSALSFAGAGFSCAGSQSFPVNTRSIFRDNVDHNSVNALHAWDLPEYTWQYENSSNWACNTNKRGLEDEIDTQKVSAGTVYPNPVPAHANAFTVEIISMENMSCELQVTDLLGRTVHRETRELQQGSNQLQVQPNDISSGVYLIRLVSANALILQERLVFQ